MGVCDEKAESSAAVADLYLEIYEAFTSQDQVAALHVLGNKLVGYKSVEK